MFWFDLWVLGSQSRGRLSDWGSSGSIYQEQALLTSTSGGVMHEVTPSNVTFSQPEAMMEAPNVQGCDEVNSLVKKRPIEGGTITVGVDKAQEPNAIESVALSLSEQDEGMCLFHIQSHAMNAVVIWKF
jgi:hypothetical protein